MSRNVQELYAKACDRYNDSIDLLTAMSECVCAVKPDYDSQFARCQFDIILQYTLLRAAIADGKFTAIEGRFIDEITCTYDILHLFDNVPDGMGWEWLAEHSGYKDIVAMIDVLQKRAENHMEFFCSTFAIVDAFTSEFDELQMLIENISAIAIYFVNLDGVVTEDEQKNIADAIVECLNDPWVNVYNKTIETLSSK